MQIEIDDDYVEWVKAENPDLFGPGQDAKAAVEQYINEVLAAHRWSWVSDKEG